MRRFHVLLAGLSLTLVTLSVNRLASFTQGRLEPDGFLRWLDLNAMLPIPLAGIVLYYLLKKDVERAGDAESTRALIALNVLFVAGIFLFGVSSGDHETTNYLSYRFCRPPVDEDLCAVVTYHDDTFSHVVYYAGVLAYTLALLAIERLAPRRQPISGRDRLGVLANAALIAAGIFANLAFEPAALDLMAFATVALVANASLWAGRRAWARLPFTFYTATSFSTGVVATLAYKLLA